MSDLSMFQITDEPSIFDSSRSAIDLAGHLLSDTAHDLRSPLAAARELVQLVADGIEGPVTDKQRQHLESVVSRCNDMQRLIDDMLHFEPSRNGMPKIARQWISPSTFPGSVQATVSSQLAQRSNSLKWIGFEDELPPVYGDSDKLSRVLVNLITNANQVVQEGETISVRSEIARTGDRMRFSVEDAGVGMNDSQIDQLARRGFSGYGGQGLGLAICRQIAGMHFTRIGVESAVNEGSRFSIELPTGGPSAVIDAFARWRETMMPSAGQTSIAEEETSLLKDDPESSADTESGKIRPRRVENAASQVRVLPTDTIGPRYPDTVTMVSACGQDRSKSAALEPIDRFLQGDCLMHELVYRVEQDQWLMLWDTSLSEAQTRIDRLEQTRKKHENDEIADHFLDWFGPVSLPVGRTSDRLRLQEAFLRGSLGLASGRGDDAEEAAPFLTPAAQKRLEAEVRWITEKFRQRQVLLRQQSDAVRPAF